MSGSILDENVLKLVAEEIGRLLSNSEKLLEFTVGRTPMAVHGKRGPKHPANGFSSESEWVS